jgi:hypothetical protein
MHAARSTSCKELWANDLLQALKRLGHVLVCKHQCGISQRHPVAESSLSPFSRFISDMLTLITKTDHFSDQSPHTRVIGRTHVLCTVDAGNGGQKTLVLVRLVSEDRFTPCFSWLETSFASASVLIVLTI